MKGCVFDIQRFCMLEKLAELACRRRQAARRYRRLPKRAQLVNDPWVVTRESLDWRPEEGGRP